MPDPIVNSQINSQIKTHLKETISKVYSDLIQKDPIAAIIPKGLVTWIIIKTYAEAFEFGANQAEKITMESIESVCSWNKLTS